VFEKNGGRPSGGASPTAPPPPSVVRIRATVAGRLVYRHSSRTWYVASNPRRYHPTRSPPSSSILAGGGIAATTNAGVGDRVIGMIEDQRASADYYRVNVFGSHPALLHVLSFEGASKRNRPTLEPGSLVYCRVVRGSGGGRMDSEVSCKVGGSGGGVGDGRSTHNCDSYDLDGDNDDGGAAGKDWMTNEGTYGPLAGGTSFRVPLGLARELLLPKNAVLDALDRSGVPFEIAVGVNGVVWTNSPEPSMTIVITNAIRNSEVMAEDLVRGMVKVMVKNAKKELDGLR
jgi:exosome complex component RRP40